MTNCDVCGHPMTHHSDDSQFCMCGRRCNAERNGRAAGSVDTKKLVDSYMSHPNGRAALRNWISRIPKL